MIIKSALLDKRRYSLVDGNVNSDENVYTLVIGENGVGKSRLLSRIVANFKNVVESKNDIRDIPHNYSRQVDYTNGNYHGHLFANSQSTKSYLGDRNKARSFEVLNSKAIAVTTSPFDKFPVEYKLQSTFRHHDDDKYHYIGLRVSKNSYSKSNFLHLFARSILKHGVANRQEKVFGFLGYKGFCRINFKTKMPVDLIPRDTTYHFFLAFLMRSYPGILSRFEHDENFMQEIFHAYLDHNTNIRNGINFCGTSQQYYGLSLLLDIGLVQVKSVVLTKKHNGSSYNISEISSGEQCVLLTILNISGVIKDNSVICIDEPEISLHPEWQEKFMPLLISSFKEYSNCHFIIATHSPLIVSELSTKNCYILNMRDRKLTPSHIYSQKSVDFQLAELFESPGSNNEYLNRLVVSLLTKFSNKGKLSEKDTESAKHLQDISRKLDDDDTVKYLIQILNKAMCKVKNDN